MEFCYHVWADAPSCYLELLDNLRNRICRAELAQLVACPHFGGRFAHYSHRLHDFSVTIPRCYKDVYVSSFFPRTARLRNSLHIECFPLTCDLNGFKSKINRHPLNVGSFKTDFLYT